MKAHHALPAIAVAFGLWETVDIVDTGVPAAVFAVLFLAAAARLVRRTTLAPTLVIATLCTFEATQAHTWKDAGATAKITAEALGSAGVLVAAVVVFTHLRSARAAGNELGKTFRAEL